MLCSHSDQLTWVFVSYKFPLVTVSYTPSYTPSYTKLHPKVLLLPLPCPSCTTLAKNHILITYKCRSNNVIISWKNALKVNWKFTEKLPKTLVKFYFNFDMFSANSVYYSDILDHVCPPLKTNNILSVCAYYQFYISARSAS